MDKIRQHLPRFLIGVGIALGIVSIIIGGLSFPNWADVSIRMLTGLALGGGVTALGLGLEALLSMAADARQSRADIRVQTEALARMTGVIQQSLTEEA